MVIPNTAVLEAAEAVEEDLEDVAALP